MESTPETQVKPVSWLDRNFFDTVKINWETILFALILILAVVTRFYDLGTRVMSHDESLHTYFSWVLYRGDGFSHTPLMHGPFQFLALALSYFLFGDSDFTARIPAVLFSIASIAFLWQYRRYLGRAGTLIAAALFTFSPYLLYYSRYVRNEPFVMLYFVIGLWATVRYLETGKPRFLYFLTVTTALHFTTKETSFIYLAQTLLFVGLVFVFRMYTRPWGDPNKRRIFTGLLILAILLLVAAVATPMILDRTAEVPIEAGSPAPQPEPGDETEGATGGFSLPGYEVALLAAAGLALVGALGIVIQGYGLANLKRMRSFGLMILYLTMILPHLAAFPMRAVGWDPLNYSSNEAMLRIAAFVVPLLLLSAAIGWWWNPKEWLINNAIFYAIFVVFFTTMFTNGPGFFSGLVGSLGYWLEQQGVRRGSQPWYYYLFIQVPIYEYLGMLGALFAGGLGVQWLLDRQYAKRTKPEFEDRELYLQELDSQELDPAEGRRLMLLQIGFWTFTAFAAYTIAGEKMPWLTVHMALPMALLAGFSLGWLVDKIDWPHFWRERGWLSALVFVVLLFAFGGLVGSLFSDPRPFSGKELVQLEATSDFLFALLATAGSVAALIYIFRGWRVGQFSLVLALTAFTLLGISTARHAMLAAYINYDEATEYLVYAHAARGVKEVMAQVEDISLRTTNGLAIQVAYDDDVSWPMTWYLRNYENKIYYGQSPTRDLRSAPIIIVGDNNFSKVEPIVGQGYERFDYIRMWWPNQDYFGLTWERFANAFTDSGIRAGIIDIWMDRDYSTYATTLGKTDLKPWTWSPSDRMRMYIRKDVVAGLYDYGVTEGAEAVVIDPYDGKRREVSADEIIAPVDSNGLGLNQPRGLASGPDGSLYIADSQNHRIVVVKNGQVTLTFGGFSPEGEPGLFNEPWGVAVSPDGDFIYVADTWNHRVQVFTTNGEYVNSWGVFATDEEPFSLWGPRDIDVDADGNLLVTNTGNKRVNVYAADGTPLGIFGEFGFEAGQFDEPVGIAVSASGRVFVADTWNQRMQAFEPDGSGSYRFVTAWDISGWYSDSLQNKPYVNISDDGNVLVTDPEASRVLVFNPDGQFLYYIGEVDLENNIALAAGVAPDGSGGFWVVDGQNNRLMHFTP